MISFDYEGETYYRHERRGAPWVDSTMMRVPADLQHTLDLLFNAQTRVNDYNSRTLDRQRDFAVGGNYSEVENLYPHHVIIQKERFMYNAHNHSAGVINQELGYKLFTDYYGRPTSGGSDLEKIENALKASHWSYIIIKDGEIDKQVDDEKIL